MVQLLSLEKPISIIPIQDMFDTEHFGEPVIITFPTFTEAANMAGMSRVMGGYHIQADNVAGLELGRNVASETWKFYNKHLGNGMN